MRTIKVKRKPHGYWYRQRVEAVIKDRVEKGLSVSPKDMIREDKGAYVAAWRTHGSWDRALIAAGVSLDVYERAYHDEEALAEFIREAYEAGADISDTTIKHYFYREHRSIVHKYKSWANFLESIGISPDEADRFTWAKGKLTEYLRQAQALGIDVRALLKLDSRLYAAIDRHFGSLDAALAEIEYVPDATNRQRAWTRELILETAAKALESGITLSALAKYDEGWRKAMAREFSGMKQFTEFLGLSVEEKGLANCLRERMQEKKVSQRELARRIGVSPTLIKCWQDGMYNPSLDKALETVKELECSVEDIWSAEKINSKTK
ncbi:hypothetical protein AAC03nite_38460 [Alicyclobacillus acidoterrestris]|nr:hypothetical protein AAC03nite_38460 [Alicyclobacillus acidoterrestris]